MAKFGSLPSGNGFRRLIAMATFGVAVFGAVAMPGVALAAAVVNVDTTSGPVGTRVTLSPTACPAPAGAGSWTSLVKFAQGSNSEVSFANYPIAADGTWGGQFTIPTAAVPGSAQLIAQCFDASHAVPTTVDYAPVNFTVTQSTLGAHENVGPVGTTFGPESDALPGARRGWGVDEPREVCTGRQCRAELRELCDRRGRQLGRSVHHPDRGRPWQRTASRAVLRREPRGANDGELTRVGDQSTLGERRASWTIFGLSPTPPSPGLAGRASEVCAGRQSE